MKKYQQPVIDINILTTDVLCTSPTTMDSDGDYSNFDIFFTAGGQY